MAFNECLIVNDSYSDDITSLQIALDFLQQQWAGFKRTVILSDFFETERSKNELYTRQLQIYLGPTVSQRQLLLVKRLENFLSPENGKSISIESYLSTDDFIKDFRASSFFREIILIKGARIFEFEQIVKLFEQKVHQTVLEVNLDCRVHNLNTTNTNYRQAQSDGHGKSIFIW